MPDPPEKAASRRSGRMLPGAIVEEVPVWLEVNGRPVVTWMCTPDLLEELAVGWLHGEGYIESAAQVHLRPCATDLGFWAEVDPARVDAVLAELVQTQQKLRASEEAVYAGVARVLLNLDSFITRE